MEELDDLLCDEALRLEPRETFDPAIVGAARHGPKGFVLCYSVERIIRALVKDGMSEEDAIEHFEFNVAGGWVGDGTPIFLVDLPDSSARVGSGACDPSSRSSSDSPSSDGSSAPS